MRYCKECGSAVDERNKYCISCGNPMGPLSPKIEHHNLEYEGSYAWFIMGFFFPVVGIVLFFVWLHNKRKSSRSALLGSFISIIVSVFLGILVANFLSGIPTFVEIEEGNVKWQAYSDGLQIEQAAYLYCEEYECGDSIELTWNKLKEYTNGIDEELYDLYDGEVVVAFYSTEEDTLVYLEGSGQGGYEIWGTTPSHCSIVCADLDRN